MKKAIIIFLILLSISSLSMVFILSNNSPEHTLNESFNNISENKPISTNTTKDLSFQENSSDVETSYNTTTTTLNEIDILESCIGKPLTQFIEKSNQLGYTATYLADGVDFSSFIEAMQDSYLTGDLEINYENKTVTVTLVLASNMELNLQKEALKEKLDPYYAWIAAEKYGKEKYGSSFELHFLVDKIAEEFEDENTWFLKAGCTVNGLEKTCEIKVSGTTNNPEITDFYIY